jgi:hypothetical protein
MGKKQGRSVGIALLWSAVLVIILSCPAAWAQTFRGIIQGTVTDASGAVLTGAKVTAHNTNTGTERTTVTNASGNFNLPELPIGTYSLKVEETGFQTSKTTGIVVEVASTRRIDTVLLPGQVQEQVEVAGESLSQVETSTDDLGSTISANTVENLPVNGRDYTKLIYLTPGITGSPDQITDSPGSFGTFSMNGARGRSNNFLLDGTDMNDGYRNDPAINQPGVFGTPSTILPIDAVSEVRVLSNFQPEFGRSAGTVISIVTKSGTNNFHGNGFDYFRNNALDARNYFNSTTDPQAPFHNNQFGGSLGGPIQKDKTFFYANYEGQLERVGVVTTGCVPQITAAQLQSANPVIRQLLLSQNPWPTANIAGTGMSADGTGCQGGNPDVSLITPSYNNLSSVIGKIDHSFNTNNQVTGRYYFGDSTQAFPLALTASGGQLPGYDTVTPTRVQLISLSYVRVISSTQVNELRYGWNRFAEGFYPQDQSFSPSSIGLCSGSTTAQCTPGNPADQGVPTIVVGGFSQIGATNGDPKHRTDTNHQALDGFSWQLGKHDVKFGGEFRRTSISQTYDKDFRGKLVFDNLTDFLAGNVDSGIQYSGDSDRNTFENSFGLYAQDSYRMTSRLTFNYGLRWDYFGVLGEKNNQLSNITATDPVAGTVTLTQVGTDGLNSLYRPDYRNFSPRVSLAWDVFGKGKTVVRTGFGVFFDSFSQDMFVGQAPYPPTFDPGMTYNPIGSAQVVPASASGTTINAGVPIYGTPGCSSECDIFSVDRNLRTPYMDNYNINIQQQLANKIVMQLGYVGSQGHRLTRYFDINQPSQAQIQAYDLANPVPNPITGALASAGGYAIPRVYGNNAYGAYYIMQLNTTGQSNYNALQASLKLSGWHGITSIVNYVWSRSMDNSSDGLDFIPNAAQPNDSTNPQQEYGPSGFDTPQRFTWIFGYELPKIGGNLQRVKNGWGFDSTVEMQSGQPFNLNYNFQDDFSGSGEGDDRPDVVGPIVYNTKNPAQYLDLSSFAVPCTVSSATMASYDANGNVVYTPNGKASDCVPGTRHFGDLGRNALRGPSYKQWDFAIYKNTSITERLKLQLRAEIFNLLNHPNFANPVLPNWIADAGAAGFALNGAGNREVGGGYYPITATGDVGVGNPFLGGGGPRGIQLAAKFSF